MTSFLLVDWSLYNNTNDNNVEKASKDGDGIKLVDSITRQRGRYCRNWQEVE